MRQGFGYLLQALLADELVQAWVLARLLLAYFVIREQST